MKKYYYAYGISGLYNFLQCFVSLFIISILYGSFLFFVEKEPLGYVVCLVVIIIAIIDTIISIIINVIYKKFAKKYIYCDGYVLRFNNKEIYVKDIISMEYVCGTVGGKHKKEEPYAINICYKKDDNIDYVNVERFPLCLVKEIEKTNNIKLDKNEIRIKNKQQVVYGIVIGIILFIILCIFK